MRTCIGMAVLLASLASLPVAISAQQASRDSSRIRIAGDVAAGIMRYGPQVALGATVSLPRSRVGARFGLGVGVAPSHDIPGRHFVAATGAGVWPARQARGVSPYLLAGGVVSASRHLAPSLGVMGGMGVRFGQAALRPFVEGRVQQREGFSFLLGVGF